MRPGPSANDNEPAAPAYASALPADALAIIEPVPVVAARGARPAGWRLRFMPRMAPVADPLTGWTGGGDPLGQIELRFPDRQSAERYCRRQGVRFTCLVQGGGAVHSPMPAQRPTTQAQPDRQPEFSLAG